MIQRSLATAAMALALFGPVPQINKPGVFGPVPHIWQLWSESTGAETFRPFSPERNDGIFGPVPHLWRR